MVKAAAASGADYVKFQTGVPKFDVSVFAEKAEYQKHNTDDDAGSESQLEMCSKLMLPFEVYPELIECCRENNIAFLSSPFDPPCARFLHEMGMHIWKIPSGEITHFPMLKVIASYGEPIIMSTGMATLEEIETTLAYLRQNGAGEITLLHCNSEYPTPYPDANIRAMFDLKKHFGLEVGYSDHTLGIEVPIAAAALGATVIEKHFTLDRTMEGPDQISSIEPDELKQLVDSIRHVEAALGSGMKVPTESERKNINVVRKSIVAARAIRKGEVYTEENLACKRPGGGISPMEWDNVLGLTAVRDFAPDEMIEL
jgi:N,N'-diacetyllegionaminate synthase